jgi:pimeloyl-ACP methyl ester carboxylesterase
MLSRPHCTCFFALLLLRPPHTRRDYLRNFTLRPAATPLLTQPPLIPCHSQTYPLLFRRDYLRDFILRVVKGPVVLAGNSIGGFISASVAADYPDLVRGLVLLNSAGEGAGRGFGGEGAAGSPVPASHSDRPTDLNPHPSPRTPHPSPLTPQPHTAHPRTHPPTPSHPPRPHRPRL